MRMRLIPLALAAASLLATPAHAVSSRWTRPPEDPFKIGIELMGFWGFGGRMGVSLDTPVLDSVHLRLGGAMPYVYREGMHQRVVGINPFSSTFATVFPTGYLAPAVDLDIWGPLELELTAGWSFLEVDQSSDVFVGLATGAALRLDFEADVPVTFNAGVMLMSDVCLCSPRLVLDIGPRFTW